MINLAKNALNYVGISTKEKNKLVDYYNSNCINLVKKSRRYKMKYDDNWCAMFTSVIARKALILDVSFPYEVSVLQQVIISKKRGCFTKHINDVKSGDLIVYNWNGDYIPDHVGFVVNVQNGVIKTVEGNIHNAVGTRLVGINSKYIYGFITL